MKIIQACSIERDRRLREEAVEQDMGMAMSLEKEIGVFEGIRVLGR
jgi:hypothetical protein